MGGKISGYDAAYEEEVFQRSQELLDEHPSWSQDRAKNAARAELGARS